MTWAESLDILAVYSAIAWIFYFSELLSAKYCRQTGTKYIMIKKHDQRLPACVNE